MERCITRGLPGVMLPGNYNHNYNILQTPTFVAILAEMIHDTRIIPIDGRRHINSSIHQWMGDSRGQCEVETLVVETRYFLRETSFRGGVTTSDLRLTERFTRISDGTLMYEVTTEDPNTWSRPWTYRIPMVKSEYPLYEYACHEGNHGLYNLSLIHI